MDDTTGKKNICPSCQAEDQIILKPPPIAEILEGETFAVKRCCSYCGYQFPAISDGTAMDYPVEIKNVTDYDIPDDITFYVAGDIEMVRLCGNGDIKVKGKLIENDKELVDGLRELLKLGKID